MIQIDEGRGSFVPVWTTFFMSLSALKAIDYSILVVDDDQDIRDLLKLCLSDMGFTVFLSRSGTEALKCLQKEKIDLILSDVIMPEMDGYQFVSEVKGNPKSAEIPFLFFSSQHRLDMRIKGLEMGASDFISKPFDPTEVCLRVKSLLEQQTRKEHRQLNMVQGALNLFQLGIVLVNEDQTVALINMAAQEVLDQADGLYIRNDRLRGYKVEETKKIAELLERGRSLVEKFDPALVHPAKLRRPSLLRDLALIAVPLTLGDVQIDEGRPMIALIVSDPERITSPSNDLLVQFYQFTSAEARVAALLIQGRSIAEIGEELEISRNTVCTHLKKLYMKTETQRQNDFTRLLLSGFPQLNLG